MQTATIGWGPTAITGALERNDLIVVVDVLRFSSTVTTAVANDFVIVPCSDPQRAERLSSENGMPVTGKAGVARYSLSPLDYLNPKASEEIILVSPNGAKCAEMINVAHTGFIGCFLNARAVGRLLSLFCQRENRNITVVACGEVVEDQYDDLETRRFAVEDYLASGLILSEMKVEPSAEAKASMQAYESSKIALRDRIRSSPSGQYLVNKGLEYDISHCVQRSIYDILPSIDEGRITQYRAN
jgi:2-phosphosulfolactate phosphatase